MNNRSSKRPLNAFGGRLDRLVNSLAGSLGTCSSSVFGIDIEGAHDSSGLRVATSIEADAGSINGWRVPPCRKEHDRSNKVAGEGVEENSG